MFVIDDEAMRRSEAIIKRIKFLDGQLVVLHVKKWSETKIIRTRNDTKMTTISETKIIRPRDDTKMTTISLPQKGS